MSVIAVGWREHWGGGYRDAITEASSSGSGGEGSSDGAEDDKDVVIVCGTVFMMVDVRQELGLDEPRVSYIARLEVQKPLDD